MSYLTYINLVEAEWLDRNINIRIIYAFQLDGLYLSSLLIVFHSQIFSDVSF